MAQPVGEPGQEVQDDILVGGQDVAQVGTIEDVFERGENFDPNRRPPLAGNKSVRPWSVQDSRQAARQHLSYRHA